MGGRAPGPLRSISSARKASHQRDSILRVRKPSKPPGLCKTTGSGASHLNGARGVRHESFGQSSIEQEAADALEPTGGALSAAGPRRAAKRHLDRCLPRRESALSCFVRICASSALRGPRPHLRSTPRKRAYIPHPEVRRQHYSSRGFSMLFKRQKRLSL